MSNINLGLTRVFDVTYRIHNLTLIHLSYSRFNHLLSEFTNCMDGLRNVDGQKDVIEREKDKKKENRKIEVQAI